MLLSLAFMYVSFMSQRPITDSHFSVCSGSIFGDKVRLDLRLLDIPMALSALEGVGMELQDSGFTLLDRTYLRMGIPALVGLVLIDRSL